RLSQASSARTPTKGSRGYVPQRVPLFGEDLPCHAPQSPWLRRPHARRRAPQTPPRRRPRPPPSAWASPPPATATTPPSSAPPPPPGPAPRCPAARCPRERRRLCPAAAAPPGHRRAPQPSSLPRPHRCRRGLRRQPAHLLGRPPRPEDPLVRRSPTQQELPR